MKLDPAIKPARFGRVAHPFASVDSKTWQWPLQRARRLHIFQDLWPISKLLFPSVGKRLRPSLKKSTKSKALESAQSSWLESVSRITLPEFPESGRLPGR